MPQRLPTMAAPGALAAAQVHAQVPTRYLAALVQQLEAEGHDCRAPLAEAGLDRALLDLHEAQVPRQAQTAAMQALARATRRSDLGFVMGAAVNLGRVDVVGPLLLNAPSLRDGFIRLAPYFALVTPAVRMRCSDDAAGGLRIRFTPSHPLPWDATLMLLEAVVVAAHRLMRFVQQERATPCRLQLSWPAPPHAARYRSLSGARVLFGIGGLGGAGGLDGLDGTPEAELRLSHEVADAALPMADATVLAQAERRCADRLGELRALRGLSAWTRALVYATEDRQLAQAEAAALLGVSARTLARLLAREGSSFGALARESRHAKACELLTQSGQSLAAIAHRLGYTDSANFSRAFKAMAGVAPGAWQAAKRAPGVPQAPCAPDPTPPL